MLDSAVLQRARATDFGGTHPSMLDGAAALILAGAGDTSSAHSDDADSTPARRDMARTQEQLQLELHHKLNLAEQHLQLQKQSTEDECAALKQKNEELVVRGSALLPSASFK